MLPKLRRFVFGWFCQLRGFHKSAKPKQLQGITQQGTRLSGYWMRFVCVCGAEEIRHADVARGGRIPVPIFWRTK